MRPDRVVIDSLLFSLLFGVCQAQEPVLVQALLPDATVERLDKCVVCRLSGTAEVEHHLVEVRSPVERLRDGLGAVVHADRRPPTLLDRVEHSHHVVTCQPLADADGQTLTGKSYRLT